MIPPSSLDCIKTRIIISWTACNMVHCPMATQVNSAGRSELIIYFAGW
jgi:hypothetical protein